MSDTRSERRARRNQDLSDESMPSDRTQPSPPSHPLAGGEGWLPIDDKAKSGALIRVRFADGGVAAARWHKTREYNPKTTKWEPTSFWMAIGARLEQDPVEYMLI